MNYKNLKNKEYLNILKKEEEQYVWDPKLFLKNQIQEKITYDRTLIINPYNLSNFGYSDIDQAQNYLIYKGSESSIVKKKTISTMLTCDFDLLWYPFDRQHCVFKFEIAAEQAERINIVPRKVEYIGPSVLSAYEVKSVKICNSGSTSGVR